MSVARVLVFVVFRATIENSRSVVGEGGPGDVCFFVLALLFLFFFLNVGTGNSS